MRRRATPVSDQRRAHAAVGDQPRPRPGAQLGGVYGSGSPRGTVHRRHGPRRPALTGPARSGRCGTGRRQARSSRRPRRFALGDIHGSLRFVAIHRAGDDPFDVDRPEGPGRIVVLRRRDTASSPRSSCRCFCRIDDHVVGRAGREGHRQEVGRLGPGPSVVAPHLDRVAIARLADELEAVARPASLYLAQHRARSLTSLVPGPDTAARRTVDTPPGRAGTPGGRPSLGDEAGAGMGMDNATYASSSGKGIPIERDPFAPCSNATGSTSSVGASSTSRAGPRPDRRTARHRRARRHRSASTRWRS